MAPEALLYVKSHVSRDLLQSAALFKNEHLAVTDCLQEVPCLKLPRRDGRHR
jgi:hypothetical protein